MAEWNSWSEDEGNYFPDYFDWSSGEAGPWEEPWEPEALLEPSPEMEILPTFEGRDDVLQINDVQIGFLLPNFLNGDYKIIRLQVTYWPDDGGVEAWLDGSLDMWVGFDPYNTDIRFPVQGDNGGIWIDEEWNGGWLTEVYEWVLSPNPAWEEFFLGFEAAPAYVDQVVIDTMCVPEPGVLSLLVVGGVALLRRRKRSEPRR